MYIIHMKYLISHSLVFNTEHPVTALVAVKHVYINSCPYGTGKIFPNN